MENNYSDETYLSHHGIIGQKWGVRRYQNRDGSLTSEGRKRRGLSDKKEDGPVKKLVKNAKEKSAAKKAQTEAEKHENLKRFVREHPKSIYKNRYEFTQDELATLVDQINYDRKLKDLRNEETQRDWDRVKSMANNLGTVKTFAENAKGIYNLAAEVNNALIDSGQMNGKRMTKLGDKAPEDHSAIDKLIRTGTPEEIQKAYKEGKLSPKDMLDVNQMRERVSKFEDTFFKNPSAGAGVTDSVGSATKNNNASDWYNTKVSDIGDTNKTNNSDWYKTTSSVNDTKVSDILKSVGSSGNSWYNPTTSKSTSSSQNSSSESSYFTDSEILKLRNIGGKTPAGVADRLERADPALYRKWINRPRG